MKAEHEQQGDAARRRLHETTDERAHRNHLPKLSVRVV
jgi:hypothetical protein